MCPSTPSAQIDMVFMSASVFVSGQYSCFSAHVWMALPVASSQKSVKLEKGIETGPKLPTVGWKSAL